MKLPTRYSISDILTALQNPARLFFELRRIALSINASYTRLRGSNGECRVVEEDWDNLIILDGCRYDMFKELNIINGKLESRISAGSESWEFLQKNFQSRQLHDTIYITANPHAPKLADDVFYQTINLLENQWNEKLKTVLPQAVTQSALETHKKHPQKRLIIHYMQPHFPFIGEVGQQIDHTGVSQESEKTETETKHIWFGLRDGKLNIPEERVLAAYKENLELVLPRVKSLIDSIGGKSIITADHGNLVGERTRPIPIKGYGHPRGFYAPGLVTVPWLIVEAEKRRNVTTGSPQTSHDIESEVVDQRLSDLGYK
jgi:hypothetical protein